MNPIERQLLKNQKAMMLAIQRIGLRLDMDGLMSEVTEEYENSDKLLKSDNTEKELLDNLGLGKKRDVNKRMNLCKDCGKPYEAHGECEYYDSEALTNTCKKFVSTKGDVQ